MYDTDGPDPKGRLAADDIAANLAQVTAVEPFTVPTSIFDEVAEICTRLEITS